VATGGIVEVDTTSSLYRLPAEHSAVLGRAAGIDNMATMMQYVGILGGVEDEIVECFRSGGGVSYDRYGRFHSVMAKDSDSRSRPVFRPTFFRWFRVWTRAFHEGFAFSTSAVVAVGS
jgi:hypothetical protein